MKKPFTFVFLFLFLAMAFIVNVSAAPSEVVVMSGSLDVQAVSKTVIAPAAQVFPAPAVTAVPTAVYDSPAVFAPPGAQAAIVMYTLTAQATMAVLMFLAATAVIYGLFVLAFKRREGRWARDGLMQRARNLAEKMKTSGTNLRATA